MLSLALFTGFLLGCGFTLVMLAALHNPERVLGAFA